MVAEAPAGIGKASAQLSSWLGAKVALVSLLPKMFLHPPPGLRRRPLAVVGD